MTLRSTPGTADSTVREVPPVTALSPIPTVPADSAHFQVGRRQSTFRAGQHVTGTVGHRKFGGAVRRLLTLVTVVLGLSIGVATAASAATSAAFYSPNGQSYVSGSATQNGWTGTVTVHVRVWDFKHSCATLQQQGRNAVTGYGAWQTVVSQCGNSAVGWQYADYSFAVHDYYSDSVAIKLCDVSGCRSAHVWN